MLRRKFYFMTRRQGWQESNYNTPLALPLNVDDIDIHILRAFSTSFGYP